MFLKQPLLLFKTYVFFIFIFHFVLYKGNPFDFKFIFESSVFKVGFRTYMFNLNLEFNF